MRFVAFIISLSLLPIHVLATPTIRFGAIGWCTCWAIRGQVRFHAQETGIPWVKPYFTKDACDRDAQSCDTWCAKIRTEPPKVLVLGDLRCDVGNGDQEKYRQMIQNIGARLGDRILLHPVRDLQMNFIWLDSTHLLIGNQIIQIPNGWQVASVVGGVLLLIATRGEAFQFLKLAPAIP